MFTIEPGPIQCGSRCVLFFLNTTRYDLHVPKIARLCAKAPIRDIEQGREGILQASPAHARIFCKATSGK